MTAINDRSIGAHTTLENTGRFEAAIDDIINDALKRNPYPALAVLIEQNGQLRYRKASGLANIDLTEQANADTVFAVGSITKSMAALCLIKLVCSKKVDLNAPLRTYLEGLPSHVANLQVRSVLTHTSGLVNYSDIPDFPDDPAEPLSRDEIIRSFVDLPLTFEPGTRWSYCNSGLYLVGLIIEAASGELFDDYLRATVFEPAGMTDASLGANERTVERRAFGYHARPDRSFTPAARVDPRSAYSAGGVMATLNDLLRYRKATIGPDAIISREAQALMLRQDRLSNGIILPYTLGCLFVSNFEGYTRIGHGGDISGFCAQYSYYPDDDLTLVVLANGQKGRFPPLSLEKKLARAALGLPDPPWNSRPLDPAFASQFIGEFLITDLSIGFDRLEFLKREDNLVAYIRGSKSDDREIVLDWLGGDTFVSSIDEEQCFRLGTDHSCVTLDAHGCAIVARRITALS